MPRARMPRQAANQRTIPRRVEPATEFASETAGKHWFGLEGASTIQTGDYLEARIAADYAVRDHAICVIYGEAGLGKSYATNHAIQPHTDRGLSVTWVEYPYRTMMKGIAATLLKAITGYSVEGDLRHVEADLLEVLGEEERLIVVDETQRLNHEALEYLRHLHDHRASCFGLLLVGGHGCWEVISRYPMLESRILVRVEFAPLTITDTLRVIPQYHPIYANADPNLIRSVHRQCTHGVFRSWAAFTKLAADLCASRNTDTLDAAIVEITLRLLATGKKR